MTDLEWKNPPRQLHDWGKIAAKLEANPGKWALVARAHTSGSCPPLKRRGIKVQSQKVGPGRFDLYAMSPGVQ